MLTERTQAYRKLSLLTHPDKNGYNGADEAFKMVSRAFQILSDPQKKNQYDQTGGDPDSRFQSQAQSSPFSGFASPRAGGRGPMFEEEISPEEMFRQFFGGGFGGGPFGKSIEKHADDCFAILRFAGILAGERKQKACPRHEEE